MHSSSSKTQKSYNLMPTGNSQVKVKRAKVSELLKGKFSSTSLYRSTQTACSFDCIKQVYHNWYWADAIKGLSTPKAVVLLHLVATTRLHEHRVCCQKACTIQIKHRYPKHLHSDWQQKLIHHAQNSGPPAKPPVTPHSWPSPQH